MPRNHEWQGNTLRQTLCGEAFTVDLAALPETIKEQALKFAIPTLLRNATAGLAETDPEKARERVRGRIAAWLAGQWSSRAPAIGEPRTSLLARALAEAKGISPAEAAEIIDRIVDKALAAAGLDPEDEADAAAVKAKVSAINKMLREAQEIAPIYKRLRDEAAAKAAASKPAISLADLLG